MGEAAASKHNSEAETDLFDAKKAHSNPRILFCEWFLQEVQQVRVTVEPSLARTPARHPAAQRASEVNSTPLTSYRSQSVITGLAALDAANLQPNLPHDRAPDTDQSLYIVMSTGDPGRFTLSCT